MANSNNIQWKRISAEGAAIVVSILLAFSIEAWWDERRDGASERVMLSSLLAELHATEISFDINDGHVAAIRDSTQQLLNAAVGPNNPLGDRDIDGLFVDQPPVIVTEDLYWHDMFRRLDENPVAIHVFDKRTVTMLRTAYHEIIGLRIH